MNKTLTDEQRSAVEVALSLIGLSADPRVAKACKGLRSLLATQQPEPRDEVTAFVEEMRKRGLEVESIGSGDGRLVLVGSTWIDDIVSAFSAARAGGA
jgi:hypothetical protein|nr:MAG TPA: hypothetical protein [Caudoviricetes sp.]